MTARPVSLRRWTAFSLALLLALATLSPGPVMSAPPVPHENPATAESRFGGLYLLRYYGDILGLLTSGDFGDAEMLLARLEAVDAPLELRFIADRYRDLIAQIGTALDSAQDSIVRGAAWLAKGDKENAGPELDIARKQLAQADLLLENLEETNQAVLRPLGLYFLPEGDPSWLAHSRLVDFTKRLRVLDAQLASLLRRLESGRVAPGPALEEMRNVIEELGGRATQGGTLRTKLAEVLRRLRAGDLEPEPRPLVSRLKLELPPLAYPGLPLRVGGQIVGQAGLELASRQVTVSLDGGRIDQFVISAASFESQVVIPAQTSLGHHRLEVAVGARDQYARISQSRSLEVVQAVPTLQLQLPRFAIVWQGLEVTGQAYSELGPLQGAMVTLELDGATIQAATDETGRFRGLLSPSNSPFLLGPRKVMATVEPREPWHAAAQAQASVLMANRAQGGMLALALFYLVGMVVVTRRRHPADGERQATPQTQRLVASGPSLEEPADAPGQLLVAYYKAQKRVAQDTAIIMGPSSTFGGYLRALGPRASPAFAELTRLVELALYSRLGVGSEAVARAHELVAQVAGAEQ